jgi:hypothetical protein
MDKRLARLSGRLSGLLVQAKEQWTGKDSSNCGSAEQAGDRISQFYVENTQRLNRLSIPMKRCKVDMLQKTSEVNLGASPRKYSYSICRELARQGRQGHEQSRGKEKQFNVWGRSVNMTIKTMKGF